MKTSKYTKFPDTLSFDEQVGKNEILVYVALAHFKNNKTGKAFPSIATIAKLARVSENTVRTALKQLNALGYITIAERFDNSAKTHKSNVYTLLNVDKKDVKSLLGGEVTETIVEPPKKKKVIKRKTKVATPKKKKVIKRKTKVTATRNQVGERSTTATRNPVGERTTTSPKKVQKPKKFVVEKEISITELLECREVELDNIIDTVLEDNGVEEIEQLDKEVAEELESIIENYAIAEGFIRACMVYEKALNETMSLKQLRTLYKATDGELKTVIEGILTMKALIKDNHKIHNRFSYLMSIVRNGISEKTTK